MAAVDLRFDQAEVWMLRNAFGVPEHLIPYILLPHHPPDGFSPYLRKNEDDTLMRELETDIQAVNALREEEAVLSMVEERLTRRNAALKQVKSFSLGPTFYRPGAAPQELNSPTVTHFINSHISKNPAGPLRARAAFRPSLDKLW